MIQDINKLNKNPANKKQAAYIIPPVLILLQLKTSQNDILHKIVNCNS